MPALSQVEGSSSTPRTLAEQLRGWSDEQLSALLEARPDLATPAPHDSSQLAARVVVKASVLRALDGLDALDLAVLQALVQETDPLEVPASASSVGGAVARLGRLGLVWGSPPRPVIVVRDVLRVPGGPATDTVPGLLAGSIPAPGRSSTTCSRPGPTDAGTVQRGRRPTWWRVVCSPASTSGTSRCPGASASPCGPPPDGCSTSRPPWRSRTGDRCWSTVPEPAPPSSSYAAPSSSSTDGEPTRPRPSRPVGSPCGTCARARPASTSSRMSRPWSSRQRQPPACSTRA